MVFKNDRLLLIHRNTSICSQWELPGGKIKYFEHPTTAARREMEEELDIRVEIQKLFCINNFTMAANNYIYYNYYAKYKTGALKLMENNLFDSYGFFEIDHLFSNRKDLSPNINMLVQKFIKITL